MNKKTITKIFSLILTIAFILSMIGLVPMRAEAAGALNGTYYLNIAPNYYIKTIYNSAEKSLTIGGLYGSTITGAGTESNPYELNRIRNGFPDNLSLRFHNADLFKIEKNNNGRPSLVRENGERGIINILKADVDEIQGTYNRMEAVDNKLTLEHYDFTDYDYARNVLRLLLGSHTRDEDLLNNIQLSALYWEYLLFGKVVEYPTYAENKTTLKAEDNFCKNLLFESLPLDFSKITFDSYITNYNISFLYSDEKTAINQDKKNIFDNEYYKGNYITKNTVSSLRTHIRSFFTSSKQLSSYYMSEEEVDLRRLALIGLERTYDNSNTENSISYVSITDVVSEDEIPEEDRNRYKNAYSQICNADNVIKLFSDNLNPQTHFVMPDDMISEAYSKYSDEAHKTQILNYANEYYEKLVTELKETLFDECINFFRIINGNDFIVDVNYFTNLKKEHGILVKSLSLCPSSYKIELRTKTKKGNNESDELVSTLRINNNVGVTINKTIRVPYYDFKGWETSKYDKFVTYDEINNNSIKTKNYAKLELKKYLIKYSVPSDLKTAITKPNDFNWDITKDGMKITDKASATGYNFAGWYLSTSDKSTYKADYNGRFDTVSTNDINYYDTEPVMLYGKFTPITFTSAITPNIEGITLKDKTIGYTIEETVTLPEPVIARNTFGLSTDVVNKGLTFNGYTLDGKAITEVGGGEDKINLGDITANFTAKTVTIIFDAGENGTVETESMPLTFLSEIPELPVAVRKGYNFVKWENTGREIKTGDVSRFVEDQTVTAKYSPKKVYLIYDTDGGTVTGKRVMVTYDKEITELSTPSKSGYNFLGWFVGDREVKNGDISDFDVDTTITAKWEEVIPDATPTPVPSEEPKAEEPSSQPTATPTPEVKGDVKATDLNKYIMADESLTEGQKTALKEIVKDITKSDGTVSIEEFKEKVKNSDALSNTVKSEIDNVITNTVKQTPLTEKQEEELYKTPEAQKAKALKVTKLKVKAKKKALNLSWKKQTGVTYQIQVSTKKSFKKSKTKTYTSSKNKFTVKKLKKKKVYYVRVRTVKIVDGIEVYGKWSAVKRKKTK